MVGVVGLSYISSAIVLAIIAFVWGEERRTAGAGVLLLSIIGSNYGVVLLSADALDLRIFFGLCATVDLIVLSVTRRINKTAGTVFTARWAGWVSNFYVVLFLLDCITLGFVSLNLSATVPFPIVMILMMNILTAGALLAAFFGLIPKNFREAYEIVRMKLTYFLSDISQRSWIMPFVTNVSALLMVVKKDSISKNDLDKVIGQRAKLVRKQRELTLDDLAEVTGVSVSKLSRIEAGQNRMPAAMLIGLAKFYEVDIRFFYEDVDFDVSLELFKKFDLARPKG